MHLLEQSITVLFCVIISVPPLQPLDIRGEVNETDRDVLGVHKGVWTLPDWPMLADSLSNNDTVEDQNNTDADWGTHGTLEDFPNNGTIEDPYEPLSGSLDNNTDADWGTHGTMEDFPNNGTIEELDEMLPGSLDNNTDVVDSINVTNGTDFYKPVYLGPLPDNTTDHSVTGHYNTNGSWWNYDYFDPRFIETLEQAVKICPEYRVCGGFLDMYANYDDTDLFDRYLALVVDSQRTMETYNVSTSCCIQCRCVADCVKKLDCCPDWYNASRALPDDFDENVTNEFDGVSSAMEDATESDITVPPHIPGRWCYHPSMLDFADGNHLLSSADIPNEFFWVIEKCQLNQSMADSEDADNCDSVSYISHDTPVSSGMFFDLQTVVHLPEADVLFRNIHCARCNDISENELTRWRLTAFMCGSDLYKLGTDNSTVIINYMQSNCYVLSEPPVGSDVSTLQCYNSIRNCNRTGLATKHDPVLIGLCWGNSDHPVFDGSDIYRNVYCYLCNQPSLDSDTASPLLSCPRRTYNGTIRNVGAVYDLYDPKIYEDEAARLDDNNCTVDQFYDPYKDICTPFRCPFYKVAWYGHQCSSKRALYSARQRVYKIPLMLKLHEAQTITLQGDLEGYPHLITDLLSFIGIHESCTLMGTVYDLPSDIVGIYDLTMFISIVHVASSDACDDNAIDDFVDKLHKIDAMFTYVIKELEVKIETGFYLYKPLLDEPVDYLAQGFVTVAVPFIVCPHLKLSYDELCALAEILLEMADTTACSQFLSSPASKVFIQRNEKWYVEYYICVSDYLSLKDQLESVMSSFFPLKFWQLLALVFVCNII